MILYTENPNKPSIIPKQINYTRLQDKISMHKNQLYCYILAINDLKMKLRKQFHLKHQKIKSLGINLTKKCKTYTKASQISHVLGLES